MLKVEIVKSIDEFKSLRNDWDDALAKSSVDDVHLTWEWCFAWWNNFGKKELNIILVKEAGNILAIAPFIKAKARWRWLPIRNINILKNFNSPSFDIILTEKEEECMEAIFHYIEKEEWDFIDFGNMPSQSRALKLLEGLADKGMFWLHKGEEPRMSPFIPIKGRWDDYYNALSIGLRRHIRKSEKKLMFLGDVTITRMNNSCEVDKFLERFFHIEASGWKGKAGTSILESREQKGLYTDLAHFAAEKGWLNISFLKLNDKEIAGRYTLEYKNIITSFKSGYDEDYSGYSPGALLLKGLLENAFSNCVVGYNFLGAYRGRGKRNMDEMAKDNSVWKNKWTDSRKILIPTKVYRKNIYPGIIYQLRCLKGFFLKNL